MPRPVNKNDLIIAANENYKALLEMISNMTENQLNTPFDFSDKPSLKEAHWSRDKNVRDLLIHLYEWHKLMLAFVKNNENCQDKKSAVSILPKGITWTTISTMNVGFWKQHQETSLETAKALFEESHKEVMNLLDNYTDEQLFTKQYYKWVGTSCLGSYFVSNLSSHYDWAMKKIKLHCKSIV